MATRPRSRAADFAQPKKRNAKSARAALRLLSPDALFTLYDTNGDGKISAKELTTVLNYLGKDANPKYVNEMLTRFDANADGYLQYNEFRRMLSAMAATLGPTPRADSRTQLLRDAFDVCDVNGDGLVSREELRDFLAVAGIHAKAGDRQFHTMDTNKTNDLNFDEFCKMFASTLPGSTEGDDGDTDGDDEEAVDFELNMQEDTLAAQLRAFRPGAGKVQHPPAGPSMPRKNR